MNLPLWKCENGSGYKENVLGLKLLCENDFHTQGKSHGLSYKVALQIHAFFCLFYTCGEDRKLNEV